MPDEQTQFERLVAGLKIPVAPREAHRRGLWQRVLDVFGQALKRYETAGPIRRRWMTLSAPGGLLYSRARRVMALGVMGLAVAALALHLTVGLMAGWKWFRAGTHPPMPAPAVQWTDVLDRLRGARAARFSMTIQPPGGTAQTYVVSVLRPGCLRLAGPDYIQVIDRHFRKVLTLWPQTRTYHLGLLEHQPLDLRLPDVMGELAGLDALAGRAAVSHIGDTALFRATGGKIQWTLRVDVHTAEPIFIRRLDPIDNMGITLTDFTWQCPLDETDFLLAPPAEYKETP
jgi:hypothetical protein